jgi:C4-dicarboxylate transporter DctM subunit
VLAFVFALGRRRLTKKIFWDSLIGTATSTAMIYFIIIGANVLIYFFGLSRLADHVVSGIFHLNVPHLVTLTLLIIVYLILGSIFDTVAAMVITLPFVLPIITNMGYHPLWWGILNVVIIETGMISPPIGLNVFVLQGITKVPLQVIYKGTVPFVLADIARIALLVLFPPLVLWLPGLVQL